MVPLKRPRGPAAWALCRALTGALVSLAATQPGLQPTGHVGNLARPVANNAVAAATIGGERWIFTALGIDSTKRWSGITNSAAAWSARTRSWRTLPPVPGVRGRLAATAQVVRGQLVVFGGYTVDSSGAERSLPDVNVFDPATGQWRLGAPIPVPVDDAVSGVFRDSLIYLVSGWHDTDNVRDVQIYDVMRDSWSRATPIPGPGVFGHSGSLANGVIVYVDGAVRQSTGAKYRLEPQTWVGTIDAAQPARITWSAGRKHPGPALYRAAAGSCGPYIILAGGSANPYNYNGIGYDGQPSAPERGVLAFDTRDQSWRQLPPLATPTMDHRGLAVLGDTAWIIGGMRGGQQVSPSAVGVSLGICPSS